MKALKIIDEVLYQVNQTSLEGYKTREHIFNTPYLSQVSELDRTVILNKLVKDNYISTIDSSHTDIKDKTPLYMITFEGVFFITKKAYRGAARKERRTNTLKFLQAALIISVAIAGVYVSWATYRLKALENQYTNHPMPYKPK